MQRSKICIIIRGGIGVGFNNNGVPVLTDFVKTMSEFYDVTVFSMIKPNDDFVPQGFQVKTIKRNNTIFLLNLFAFIRLIRKEHIKTGFKLMHGFGGHPSALILFVLKLFVRVPTILSLTGGDSIFIPSINFGHLNGKLKRKLLFYFYSKVQIVNVLTRYQFNILKSYGYKKNNIRITPYGTDLVKFPFMQKTLNEPCNLISVADINKVKDYKTLLLAFKEIEKQINCRLQIIGIDTLNGEIQRFALEIGVDSKVEFVGIVDHKEIIDYLNKSHILLLTSKYDAQAVVVAEAMAAGLVVCGTRVGLIADLEGKEALAASIGNYKEIAQLVVSLIKDPQLYNDFQTNGYNWAKKYNFNWTMDKFRGYYNELMG